MIAHHAARVNECQSSQGSLHIGEINIDASADEVTGGIMLSGCPSMLTFSVFSATDSPIDRKFSP